MDVWYDSGAMPFAQDHHPFATGGDLTRALPGRLHLRGARPDARLVLLAARREHAAVRRDGLPQRRLPRPDPRRRGPEDEQEQGQRHRALDRARPPGRRRVPLVPAHRAEPVGLVPLQPRGRRRGHAALPADALEHPRVPRHLRGPARRLGPGGDGAGAGRAAARSTAGSSPASTRRSSRSRAASRATTPPAPAGRWRASSTTSPTGTSAPSRRRFWGGRRATAATGRRGARGRRRGLRDPARVPRDDRPARGALLPLRGRGDATAPSSPPTTPARPRASTWPTGPRREGPPDPGARGGDGRVPRGGHGRARRPRRGQAEGAPAAGRGGRGLRRRRRPRRSGASSTSSPRSSTCAACASSPTRASWST